MHGSNLRGGEREGEMGIRSVAVLAFLGVTRSLVLEGASGADIAPLLLDHSALAPAEAPRHALSLVFFDPMDVLPIPAQDVAAEVKEIFKTLGVPITWRDGRASPTTTLGELQVILLASDRSGGRLGANTMGAVRKGRGVSGALWVFLPAVQNALGITDAGHVLSSRDRRALTMALGRVIAHETVHAVAPDLPHSRHGLMASRMDRNELSRDRLEIDEVSRRAFFAGLTTWGVESPAPTAAPTETVALKGR